MQSVAKMSGYLEYTAVHSNDCLLYTGIFLSFAAELMP